MTAKQDVKALPLTTKFLLDPAVSQRDVELATKRAIKDGYNFDSFGDLGEPPR